MPLTESFQYTIPDLFSFPWSNPTSAALNEIASRFHQVIPTLNRIAKDSADSSCYTIFYFEITLNHYFEVTLIQDIRRVKNFMPFDQLLYARLCMAFCFLKFFKKTINHRELSEYINVLCSHAICEEIWWYIACLNRLCVALTGKATCSDWLLWLTALEHIRSAAHKKCVYGFILQYGTKENLFHNPQEALRLNLLFVNPGRNHLIDYVWTKHNFVRRSLHNSNYFKFEDNQHLAVNKFEVSDEIELSENNFHEVLITKALLIKFAAHLVPIAPITPQFKMPGLSEEQCCKLSVIMREKLISNGYCSIDGFLKENFFAINNVQRIRELMLETITEMELVKTSAERAQARMNFQQWNTADLFPQFKAHQELLADLSGANLLDALHLFYLCLIDNPNHGLQKPWLTTCQRLVKECLYYAYKAQTIKQSYPFKDRHKKWFALAEEIVADLWQQRQAKIIAVGTPILPKEKHSSHAFYVCFKYLLGSNQFRVIIANGGLGVDQFHRRQLMNDGDIEYTYAAFEPLSLTPENRQLLTDYIYGLVSIEYSKATTQPKKNPGKGIDRHQNSFENLMRNVYLRTNDETEPSYFKSFSWEKIYLRRQDLNVICLKQFTGNCAVHNLKKILEIVLSLDTVQFGQLEDNLLLGFDRLVEDNPGLKLL